MSGDLPKKAGGYHRKDSQVIDAIYACYGNITEIAHLLGLKSTHELRNRIMRNPVLKEALMESREVKMDLIENAFIQKIKEGDRYVIIQGLKSSLMRNRGFGNKVEVESVNTNINKNIDLSTLSIDELLQYENLVKKITKEEDE
jgi:hypothetical protein